MVNRYVVLAVAIMTISGCASVHLEGVVGDSCEPKAVAETSQTNRSDFGFVGQLPINGRAIDPSALLAAPKTDLFANRIDSNSVKNGLAKARQSLPQAWQSALGLTSDAGLIPWIREYGGVTNLPAHAIEEGNHARSQINRMWNGVPGMSSDFRARKVTPNKIERLGTVTADDAAFFSGVEKTLAAGGYDALTLDAYGNLVSLLESGAADDTARLQQLAQEFNTARFVSTYFRAYFRGGRFIQVSLDTDDLTKRISDEILDTLKNDVQLKEDQKKRLADSVKSLLQRTCRDSKNSEAGPCLLSRALGDDSFVTRAGINVQFAGVSVTVGDNGKLAPALTYPATTEFGPQLVRVLMEAIFDSHGLGPAQE